MLSDTLRRLISDGFTTGRELSELAGVSEATVHRYITDETQPAFDFVRQIVRHHPSPEVKSALVACLTAGTDLELVNLSADLDADRDGEVSPADAIEAMAKASEQIGALTRQALKALRDGEVSQSECAEFLAAAAKPMAEIVAAKRVMALALEKGGQRKQARRPALVRTA